MDHDRLRAKLTHVGTATLPRLCAHMTQLVIPHLPSDLSTDTRMVDAVSAIDAFAIDAFSSETRASDPAPMPGGKLVHVIHGLRDLIDERQDDFEDAACQSVGKALTATLTVAKGPTLEGAMGALLAVYSAVEMKAFMSSDQASDRVMVTSTPEHRAFMEKIRHSPAVTGFEKILDLEIARDTASPN